MKPNAFNQSTQPRYRDCVRDLHEQRLFQRTSTACIKASKTPTPPAQALCQTMYANLQANDIACAQLRPKR